MNFIQILKRLEAYSLSLPYVNDSHLGDIYEYLNGEPNVKYASVNIDITNSVRNDNLTSYSVYLYYIDRLTEDKSNWMEIKTTAEQVLNSIINYAATIGDVNDGWTINYFEQQFADYCAGGYVQFNLEVPNVMGDCLIDEYEEGEIVYPDFPEHRIIDDNVIVTDKTWSSFKINEELNNKQDKLIAGENITIEDNVISATKAAWGNITGDINDQTDLKNALDAKQDVLTPGANIDISNGVISATGGQYELPIATKNRLGGIKPGFALQTDSSGELNMNIGAQWPLMIINEAAQDRKKITIQNATKSVPGIVSVGDGINVENGVISVDSPDLSNYVHQGSNQLTKNLNFFGEDSLSNVTIRTQHADLIAQSYHKTGDDYDRGIFYRFTPDKIVFQNATTDANGDILSVNSEYKQTTNDIELTGQKIKMNPTSAFEVSGAMNVTASDKSTKFNNKNFEAKVESTFAVKNSVDEKLFETKSGQTRINTRLDVQEPERGNSLRLKKDGFETTVISSYGKQNWQKMTAGGNPFAFGVENNDNINSGAKTAFLSALSDGSIYVYGIGSYDGTSTDGCSSLQDMIRSGADLSDYYTITEVDDLLNEKQDTLIAGDGITINNNEISTEVAQVKTAEVSFNISDCATYENVTLNIATDVDTYYQTITGVRNNGDMMVFNFAIQYKNPLITMFLQNNTRYQSQSGSWFFSGFWFNFYNQQITPLANFNNNYKPIILSFLYPHSQSFNGQMNMNGNYQGVTVQFNLANYNYDDVGEILLGELQAATLCYAEDTLITLADGTTKKVQDITYNDLLKVWNFDEGKSDSAKPIWIKIEQTANQYALVKLSDGNSIKLVGSDGKYHCMFDMDEQKFNHAIDCIGHNVYTENGIVKVESLEIVNEPVKFYNIVTNVHLNCYTNHILTSTEKNNIYPINDMKFVKDNRKFKPYEIFENYGISLDDYNGWRLAEQPMSVEECVEFVKQRTQLKQ